MPAKEKLGENTKQKQQQGILARIHTPEVLSAQGLVHGAPATFTTNEKRQGSRANAATVSTAEWHYY